MAIPFFCYIVFVDALLCYLGLLTYATYYLIFCSMFPFLSPTYFIHFIWLPKYIKLLMFIQVATGQIASTGMALLSYVQKVSDKVSQSWHSRFVLSLVLFISYIEFSLQVSLATDLMCNFNSMSRDVTASFGYDYILRQVLSTTYLVWCFVIPRLILNDSTIFMPISLF